MLDDSPILFDVSLMALGDGHDQSEAVSRAVDIISRSGLQHQVTGSGTLVEGTWDEVIPLVGRCMDELGEAYPRVHLTLTADYHDGASGRLASSVRDVEAVLERQVSRAV